MNTIPSSIGLGTATAVDAVPANAGTQEGVSPAIDPRDTLLLVEVTVDGQRAMFPIRQFDARSHIIEVLHVAGVEQGAIGDVVRRLDTHQGVGRDDPQRTYEGFSLNGQNGDGPVKMCIRRFQSDCCNALRDVGVPVVDLDRIGRRYYRKGDEPRKRVPQDMPPELEDVFLNSEHPVKTPGDLGWRTR